MYILNKRRKGFTLAEVLITLTIIGIVASLVIPSLIQRTNDQQYNVGIKNVSSMLVSAIISIQNNGIVHVGTGTAIADLNTLRDDFCGYMNCVKKDNTYNIFGANGVNYKYYKGNYADWPASDNLVPSVVLNNGYYVRFNSYNNCTYLGINVCGDIWVDINGSKGPNMIGKDAYPFWIILTNDAYKIVPAGYPGDGQSCVTGSSSWVTSNGCAYARLLNPDNMP